jgi:hypothetical protein
MTTGTIGSATTAASDDITSSLMSTRTAARSRRIEVIRSERTVGGRSSKSGRSWPSPRSNAPRWRGPRASTVLAPACCIPSSAAGRSERSGVSCQRDIRMSPPCNIRMSPFGRPWPTGASARLALLGGLVPVVQRGGPARRGVPIQRLTQRRAGGSCGPTGASQVAGRGPLSNVM